jgi:Uma2 family endonuclease
MWGLEYLFLFGVPKNKVENYGDGIRCALTFPSRDVSETVFLDWAETWARWKQLPRPEIVKEEKVWKAQIGASKLALYPLPIESYTRLTVYRDVFEDELLWRRDLWPGQPHGLPDGWEPGHWDIRSHLHFLLSDAAGQLGGCHGFASDLVLNETSVVAPDAWYMSAGSRKELHERGYGVGVPDLIAEVLSPSARAADRGPRMELYRAAGVPRLWLVEPPLKCIELYELVAGRYRMVGMYRDGDDFEAFPGIRASVAEILHGRWTRLPEPDRIKELEPVPEWFTPPDQHLGLENMLLMGHPERRYEIWNNRAPCVQCYGCEEEARLRLAQFLEDACHWEGLPVRTPEPRGADEEVGEAGKFSFTRRGRLIYLDVAVDARLFRELLVNYHRSELWDWGEDD